MPEFKNESQKVSRGQRKKEILENLLNRLCVPRGNYSRDYVRATNELEEEGRLVRVTDPHEKRLRWLVLPGCEDLVTGEVSKAQIIETHKSKVEEVVRKLLDSLPKIDYRGIWTRVPYGSASNRIFPYYIKVATSSGARYEGGPILSEGLDAWLERELQRHPGGQEYRQVSRQPYRLWENLETVSCEYWECFDDLVEEVRLAIKPVLDLVDEDKMPHQVPAIFMERAINTLVEGNSLTSVSEAPLEWKVSLEDKTLRLGSTMVDVASSVKNARNRKIGLERAAKLAFEGLQSLERSKILNRCGKLLEEAKDLLQDFKGALQSVLELGVKGVCPTLRETLEELMPQLLSASGKRKATKSL